MLQIETNRFLLNMLELEDHVRVYEILNDEEVTKYLNVGRIKSLDDAKNLVQDYLEGYKNGTKYPFAITSKDRNGLIGVFIIKLDLFDDDCFEFTVFIDKEYWNNGVYSEVLPYMTAVAFDVINTGNFRGFVMSSNRSSARVLIKNGFTLEKTFCVDGIADKIESYLLTHEQYKRGAGS